MTRHCYATVAPTAIATAATSPTTAATTAHHSYSTTGFLLRLPPLPQPGLLRLLPPLLRLSLRL
eukprot:14629094-Alexandrium_andersonii.AAC.1